MPRKKKSFDVAKEAAKILPDVFKAMAESAMKPGIAGMQDRKELMKYATSATDDYNIDVVFIEITQNDVGNIVVIPTAPETTEGKKVTEGNVTPPPSN